MASATASQLSIGYFGEATYRTSHTHFPPTFHPLSTHQPAILPLTCLHYGYDDDDDDADADDYDFLSRRQTHSRPVSLHQKKDTVIQDPKITALQPQCAG